MTKSPDANAVTMGKRAPDSVQCALLHRNRCWRTMCKRKQQDRAQKIGLLSNRKTNTGLQQVGEWADAQAGTHFRIVPGSSVPQGKVNSPDPALGDVFFNDSWVVL